MEDMLVCVCVCVCECVCVSVRVCATAEIYFTAHFNHDPHALMCLQRETRSHYSCPNASGLELEYEGGGGSRFSHWEMRLVEVISANNC